MVKVSDIKDKIESDFNKMFIHKAYIQYFYDSKHFETRLKPIERIPLVLRLKNYQETFILRKPSYYLNGKPVFQLLRGYPLSIQMSLLQETNEVSFEILNNVDLEKTIINVKDCLKNSVDKSVILEIDNIKPIKNKTKKDKSDKSITINTHILEKRLVEKNSSFELDTWTQTSYNNVLLKKKFLDLQVLIIFAMCIVSTILLTWLVADNYFEVYYKAKYKSSILIPILSIILAGVLYF